MLCGNIWVIPYNIPQLSVLIYNNFSPWEILIFFIVNFSPHNFNFLIRKIYLLVSTEIANPWHLFSQVTIICPNFFRFPLTHILGGDNGNQGDLKKFEDKIDFKSRAEKAAAYKYPYSAVGRMVIKVSAGCIPHPH